MLLAEISQNWAVVPIVMGAIGYLLLAWRRAARGGGGCCSHASSCMPSLKTSDSDEQARSKPQQLIHADHLAYRASALRRNQDDRERA